MRLGCCGSLDQAATIRDLGFDFLEVNVQQVLRGDDDDAAWQADAPDPDALPLPIEAANCLVPPSHPLIGPQRDLAGLKQYVQRVTDRAGRLGIRRLVFGSGAARRRPDAVSTAEAMAHLVEFCRLAGDACARHDILLVIEHLHRGETNTLNTLAEAKELMQRTDHPHVMLLVDSFHFGLEGETEEALVDLGDRIRHVHVAEPVDRREPGAFGAHEDNPDAFDFESFFCTLRKIGYDERVSIEARFGEPFEQSAGRAASFVRQLWTHAGRCEV